MRVVITKHISTALAACAIKLSHPLACWYNIFNMAFTNPDNNVSQFGLMEGQDVAVFGSGAGGHSFAAYRAMKGTGRVYAIDVRQEMLDRLKSDARENGAGGIQTVLGNVERVGGTGLRDQSVDAVIIPNTMFSYDDREGVLKEALRLLKPGGRMLLVDWSGSFSSMGPSPDHLFGSFAAEELAQKVGFIYEDKISAGDQHYGIIFSKEKKDQQ